MASFSPENDPDRRLVRFACVMSNIPRRALRCEIYGTVSAAVDTRAVTRIFGKVSPAASHSAIHAALVILQDRLDAVEIHS